MSLADEVTFTELNLSPIISREGSDAERQKCGRGAEGSDGQALETREEVQVTANTPNRAIQQEIIK